MSAQETLTVERVRMLREGVNKHHEFGKHPGIVQCAYPFWEGDRELFIALCDHWLATHPSQDVGERECKKCGGSGKTFMEEDWRSPGEVISMSCKSCGGRTGFVSRRGTIDLCDDPWHEDMEARVSELSKHIARWLFELGTNNPSGLPVTRMQYMHGKYPNQERPGGGLCEEAMRDHIAAALEAFNSLPSQHQPAQSGGGE